MDDDAKLPDVSGTIDPAAAAQVAQLKALQAQLEAAQAQGAAHEGAAAADGAAASNSGIGDPILFGYSFAGIMACLVWSTVAIAMFRYAKITSSFLWAICGALLFVLTYLSTNDVVLWGGGAAVIGAAFVVKRFVTF